MNGTSMPHTACVLLLAAFVLSPLNGCMTVQHGNAVVENTAGHKALNGKKIAVLPAKTQTSLATDSGLEGKLHVLGEMIVFAVCRNEVPRTGQAQNELQLLLAGMAGSKHARGGAGVYFRAAARKVIDQAGYRPLVAGDDAGGKHDRVTRPSLHVRMVVGVDASERGARLALTAGS